ncbi:metal ABC transporter solute-binding protein, Zn/Mn family [Companilactobacillus sp.]|jgi:zinc/manganese transport system substrate-binding protein|uniref:metal ABC transporter solute-binding protein, Zn/Mn family n=1 Tax=Companilactobacillus sp. TaxID=2767905 RepID=UPI0025BCE40D|nr:zinc ABC transporter substrate-binding protein [Companilactobacillus sp.]MCH4009881.1 zinc ABC transporter substrate-binding protein [Companilactobacillus sp.]MCH4052443.1 zinc ABC transporter substrate-binding protein [Companilactobacillus sp.]MCH4077823.1 zinc ABC transporter substrate-binding protein [Companilactobacillus sp.]MCH4126399.1 zinc ABC transporter substrate-binding protein [Companilactobacillus sp.]MCI1312721.1 zinc ABC transporter substrate-binding protein [Companilactobacil
MKRKRYIFGILLLSLLLLVGCSKQSTEKKILTTTNTYYEPVKSIVGNKYKVQSIVKSVNVDPHSYTPTADVSQKVAKAPLIISNGIGYDDWINKLAEANNKQDSVINFGSDVLHYKDGANEHLWFSVSHMKLLTKTLYERVSESDNLNKKYYKNNYHKYNQKLDKLIDKESQIKKDLNGKNAYVTEPLPDYLLKDLGVTVKDNHFAKSIEDGTDPSIKDIKDIQNGLKNHQVDFLVVNKQVHSSIVNKIKQTAKDNDVPIIYLTETLPSNLGYYEWMNQTLDQFAKVANKG